MVGLGCSQRDGDGEYLQVSCNPDCANGTQQSYAATVTVTGLNNGSYTEMTVSVPQHSPSASSYSLGPTGPTVQQG